MKKDKDLDALRDRADPGAPGLLAELEKEGSKKSEEVKPQTPPKR